MKGGTSDGGRAIGRQDALARRLQDRARARADRGVDLRVFCEVVGVGEGALAVAGERPRFGGEELELRERAHRHRERRSTLRDLIGVFAPEEQGDAGAQIRRPRLAASRALERVDLFDRTARIPRRELELERPQIQIRERPALGLVAHRERVLDRFERRARRLEDPRGEAPADALEELRTRWSRLSRRAGLLAFGERANRARYVAHVGKRYPPMRTLARPSPGGVFGRREVHGRIGRRVGEERHQVELLEQARCAVDSGVHRQRGNVQPSPFVVLRARLPEPPFEELRGGEERHHTAHLRSERVGRRERPELARDRLGERARHPFHLEPLARKLGGRAIPVLAHRPGLVVRAELDLVRLEQSVFGVEGTPFGPSDDTTTDLERARSQACSS